MPIASCLVSGAAGLLAGCGGSADKESTTPAGSTSSTAPAASTVPSGLSLVEQFRSPAAARDALAFYVSRLKAPGSTAGAYVSFKVSGIPGAAGFSLGGASGGVNIAFTRGDSYYLVGQGGAGPAAIGGLNAAARHLYDRVGG